MKIITISYNKKQEISRGAVDFVTWFLPQLQFRNPSVQIVTFQGLAPTPFVCCYLRQPNEEVLVDCSMRTAEQIHDHLRLIVGKSEEQILRESVENQVVINPANFGKRYPRQCGCEIFGQVPCPSVPHRSLRTHNPERIALRE